MTVLLSGDSVFDFLPLLREAGDPDGLNLTTEDTDGFDTEKSQYEAVERSHGVFFSEPRW